MNDNRSPNSPPAEAQASALGFVEAIRRARSAIEAETQDLRSQGAVDHARHRRNKDVCLLDLSRRSRNFVSGEHGPEMRTELTRLRDAIIENQSLLKMHLSAARSVANLILNVIVEEDSDRTYGARAPARNAAR